MINKRKTKNITNVSIAIIKLYYQVIVNVYSEGQPWSLQFVGSKLNCWATVNYALSMLLIIMKARVIILIDKYGLNINTNTRFKRVVFKTLP